MNEKFWKFVDSAKGFWTLIISMILLGIAYMIGSHKMIDEIMRKRNEREL